MSAEGCGDALAGVEVPTCEYLARWKPNVEFCGKVATRRYPAMGGGYMHLCMAHAKGHERYSEACYDGER